MYGSIVFSLSANCFSIRLFNSSIEGLTPSYAVLILSCSTLILSCSVVSILLSLFSYSSILRSNLTTSFLILTILSSIISNWATFSVARLVCWICALLKKPKIPILVINISNNTATDRYVLIRMGACRQCKCNHTADVSLPISSTEPMIIIGIIAAENIATRPTIL